MIGRAIRPLRSNRSQVYFRDAVVVSKLGVIIMSHDLDKGNTYLTLLDLIVSSTLRSL